MVMASYVSPSYAAPQSIDYGSPSISTEAASIEQPTIISTVSISTESLHPSSSIADYGYGIVSTTNSIAPTSTSSVPFESASQSTFYDSPSPAPVSDTYGSAASIIPSPAPVSDTYGSAASIIPSPAPASDTYGYAPSPAPASDSYGYVAPSPAPVPQNQTATPIFAAVLFEQTQFNGIKHWIEGTLGSGEWTGECRGLSGVPVESVKFVTAPGADPVLNATQSNMEEVTLTFFDTEGCSGNIILTSTGNQADLKGKQLPIPVLIVNGTAVNATGPRSVKFVKTQVALPDEAPKANTNNLINQAGFSGASSVSAVSTATSLMVLLTALFFIQN